MAERTVEHPGRDEELAESYALGRLSSAARKQIEDHLAGCAECRDLIGEELRIAAGLRRAGREEMRSRLRRRLASAGQESDVPWPRVLAIAASLLLLVGIGVVRFWVMTDESVEGIPGVTESRELAARPGKVDLPAPVEQERGKPADFDKQGGGTGDVTGRLRQGAKVKEAKDAEVGLSMGEETVRGEILPPAVEATVGVSRATDALEGRRDVSALKREKGAAEAPAASRLQLAQNVQLLQSPKGRLQQLGAAQQQFRREMEARIHRVDNLLVVTLYPDTPYAQSVLDAGRAELLSSDSLRVTIGGETIIYRLPPPLQQNPPAR